MYPNNHDGGIIVESWNYRWPIDSLPKIFDVFIAVNSNRLLKKIELPVIWDAKSVLCHCYHYVRGQRCILVCIDVGQCKDVFQGYFNGTGAI